MPSISFIISYQKNTSQVISASELKSLYFASIPLKNLDGSPISDETINFWIQSSQAEIEDLLEIKLKKQAYTETREFVYDDWIQWGYIPTTYPVVQGLSVKGFLNTTLQVDYPSDWLSVKSSSDKELFHRSINLVPVQGSANQLSGNGVVFAGVAPYIGFFGRKMIPNYWSSTYIIGYDKVPDGILKAITLKAAIGLLPIASQGVMPPGVASKSLGIDGLSQSVTSTANANSLMFGALIKEYQRQLDLQIDILKKKFVGITFGVLG